MMNFLRSPRLSRECSFFRFCIKTSSNSEFAVKFAAHFFEHLQEDIILVTTSMEDIVASFGDLAEADVVFDFGTLFVEQYFLFKLLAVVTPTLDDSDVGVDSIVEIWLDFGVDSGLGQPISKNVRL